MAKMAIGRLEQGRAAAACAVDTRPVGTVRCLACFDAGFVRADVALGHPAFGNLLRCQHCDGRGMRGRADEDAVYAAMRERERAQAPRTPVSHVVEPSASGIQDGVQAVAATMRFAGVGENPR